MFQLATKLRPNREALEIAEQAGFPAVEFWTSETVLADRRTLAALALDFSFDYVLHFPNRGELGNALLEHAALLYQQLDCEAMVIHRPMYERYADKLLTCHRELRLGVENHELTPNEFREWANRYRWLTLDVEHLWKYTLEDGTLDQLLDALADFLRQYGDKLVHVHLPGYLPLQGEHRPMYCSREMVMSVWSALEDFGFGGLVVSEIDREYQNLQDMTMDCLLHQRWKQVRQHVAAAVRSGR